MAYLPDGTGSRAHWSKYGLAGRLLQQVSGGLIHENHTEHIDLESVKDLGPSDVFHVLTAEADASIGDHDIEMIDSMLGLEFFD